MKKVIRTERGWAGHFICADDCRFRRNTLLRYGKIEIVVSTVGLMENPLREFGKSKDLFCEIGYGRYYETMAFHAKASDTRYHDADISRPVDFDSPWSISVIDADDVANTRHEAVVAEITAKLQAGDIE